MGEAEITFYPLYSFPNYFISKCGLIKRVYQKNKKEKILKPRLKNHGYYSVNLSVNGVTYEKTVHRLVAKQFLPYFDNLVVNHKNGIKIDNRLENLEFISSSENIKHASKCGLVPHSENRYNAKLKTSDIDEIRNSNCSHKILSKKYGVNKSTISRIKLRKRWTHV